MGCGSSSFLDTLTDDHQPEPITHPYGTGSEHKEQLFDFRVAPSDSYHDSEPRLEEGKWTDKEFPPHTAIHEFRANGLEWKRPTEFTERPVLFSDWMTKFDIGQGAAGTSHFLSIIAILSENPKLLAEVVQEGDYSPDRGVFHCRFWKFGEWQDVYIDDFLPVINGRQIWGARSANNDSEMWVSLLEKAFAKFHGSYNSIYGGQPSEVYLALTGGIAEWMDLSRVFRPDPEVFHAHVRNALRAGAMVTCTVPDKFDKEYGLVGGHAYTLTRADVGYRGYMPSYITLQHHSVMYDSLKELLFRVRNPWGKTEWTGPWCNESYKWMHIKSYDTIKKLNIDDGEFWINVTDFLKYFSQPTICSLTPDFDMDGNTDQLNCTTSIYGQWLGETAAGYKDLDDYLRILNPKFIFTVPNIGMSKDGLVCMVVQLIQRTEHRKSDKIPIRCDLYKVLTAQKGRIILELLDTLTMCDNEYDFYPSVQCSFRYAVEPGQYVVVPTTEEPGLEREFLIRIFSPCELEDCVEVPRSSVVIACLTLETLTDGEIVDIPTCETFFGAWKAGYNAGGQISKRDTHHTNPQYAFTVPDTGSPVHVVFYLFPAQEGQQFPVGLRVYHLRTKPPVDINYLRSHYDNCPEPKEGKTDIVYELPPGDYLVLLHMDEVDTEREFVFHVKSPKRINMRGYQTGE